MTTATLASAGVVALANTRRTDLKGKDLPGKEKVFKSKFASHFGLFKNHAGDDPIDELQFIYDMGFRALEDNGMKGRPVQQQEKIASKMGALGIDMGVFVANNIYWTEPNLTNGDKKMREDFLKDIKDSVEVAKRVNAKWMTVVPGHVDLRKDMGYQTANVIESLKRAAEILEPHNQIMVLEPLNFRDHPGQFLNKISQAYEICKAVDSPSVKILFDIYHQQIHEGNIIPNIDLAWEEVAYFQIGDNPGRKEPTTGEINFKNIFNHIYQKGYRDILGMEHGKSKEGKEGEKALITAYRSVDVE
ncbi:MAG: TIM barrel protein [Cyclobacteriaceae bacterium]|nr:TIM barrel protein [Cyclobacteriaceae bacterium]